MNSTVIIRFLACLSCALAAQCAAAQGDNAHGGDAADAQQYHFLGFGDIGYLSRDGTDEDGFVIGQVVAHLVASMGESFSVFGEFSATARDTEYATEVERLIVKYDFSDRFKLSAGRYHTPIGYWNSAFHHGAWLQTSVSRPEMVRFGSEIVPIHFVGVLLEGNLPSGDLGLNYKAGFGNGRHANIARAGDAGDINGDKAWMLQLGARPRKYQAFDIGVGVYNDEIALPLTADVEETTVSAYAAWSREQPEVILEYLHSKHEAVGGGASGTTDGWYAQFAWRLSGKQRDWKPYARLEKTEIDASDPLLGGRGLDYDAGIVGARWDFNPFAALKAEYRREEFGNAGRENNFRLQLSFVLTQL